MGAEGEGGVNPMRRREPGSGSRGGLWRIAFGRHTDGALRLPRSPASEEERHCARGQERLPVYTPDPGDKASPNGLVAPARCIRSYRWGQGAGVLIAPAGVYARADRRTEDRSGRAEKVLVEPCATDSHLVPGAFRR